MTDGARCPECGREAPAGTAPVGLCPFCLLQLGLGGEADGRSAWLDPDRWPCRVLNVLDVEGVMTSYLAELAAPTRRLVVLTQLSAAKLGDGASSRSEGTLRSLVDFTHALVARVFGVLRSEERAMCLVSEHIPGAPLVRHCAKTGADARQRAALCLSAVEAVLAVHAAGLVHGRLMPDRVVLTSRGGAAAPMITGLGLSWAAGETPAPEADAVAMVELARRLGLDVPARPRQNAAELAAWLRGLTAPTSARTPH